jgi:transposase
VGHKQLYRIADKLYGEKEKLDEYLYERVTHLFNLDDKLVIFDLSNTYFESRKDDSNLAQYGRSKEKRSDCKQVVFTGVINAEGFIRHSRIYEGNMPDVKSLEDMLEDLEVHSSKKQSKTIVIDAGIATQDNLKLIAGKGYKYVCVARSKLKDYEQAIVGEKTIQLTDTGRNRVELKVIAPGQGYADTWMYVKSDAKAVKEQSMDDKLTLRFVRDMEQIKNGIHKKGGTKLLHKVWERIGRVKQKYPGIAKDYDIEVMEQKPEEKAGGKKSKPLAAEATWTRKPALVNAAGHGVYFIRTNFENPREKELWDIYNTIREVEATFRCLKSDLNIRPVHHQRDDRISSHIYLTILAYQLVNTIRHMLKQKNIHYAWSNIVRILNTHIIQTIMLPTPAKTIHLRKPSQPIEKAWEIYQATNTSKIMTPTVKYVVYH